MILQAGNGGEFDLVLRVDESASGIILNLDTPVCAGYEHRGSGNRAVVSAVAGIRSGDDEALGKVSVLRLYRDSP
jgi:hypothetical protein